MNPTQIKYFVFALFAALSLQTFAQSTAPTLITSSIAEATGQGCGDVTNCEEGKICFDVFFEVDQPGWNLQSYNIWLNYGEDNSILTYANDGACHHENGGAVNFDKFGKYRVLAARQALELEANQPTIIHNFCLNVKDMKGLRGLTCGAGDSQFELVSSVNLVDITNAKNAIHKLVKGTMINLNPNTLSCIKKHEVTLHDVTQIELTAGKETDKVVIDWSSDNLDNAALFEVQRSTNGFDFETIARVSANEDARFLDHTPLTSNYYRIGQVDNNGTIVLSDIQFVSFSDQQVYPIPFVNELNLNFEAAGEYTIELYSTAGELIKTSVVNNKDVLNVTNLTSGIYLLKAKDSQGIEVYAETVLKASRK